MTAVLEEHYTGTIHGLDDTGDTKVKWDTRDPESVEVARKAFNQAKADKRLIYSDNKAGAEKITEFDPKAGKIVIGRQLQGG